MHGGSSPIRSPADGLVPPRARWNGCGSNGRAPVGFGSRGLGGLIASISTASLEEATIRFCRGGRSCRNTMAASGDTERPTAGEGRGIDPISLN